MDLALESSGLIGTPFHANACTMHAPERMGRTRVDSLRLMSYRPRTLCDNHDTHGARAGKTKKGDSTSRTKPVLLAPIPTIGPQRII